MSGLFLFLLKKQNENRRLFQVKAYLFPPAELFRCLSESGGKTGISGLKYDLNGTREGGTWHWPAGPRYAVRGIYSAWVLVGSVEF